MLSEFHIAGVRIDLSENNAVVLGANGCGNGYKSRARLSVTHAMVSKSPGKDGKPVLVISRKDKDSILQALKTNFKLPVKQSGDKHAIEFCVQALDKFLKDGWTFAPSEKAVIKTQ